LRLGDGECHGSLRSLFARLSRIDVVFIDDWTVAPLSELKKRDFWEICEDRYQARSTILTSQLSFSMARADRRSDVGQWHHRPTVDLPPFLT
jgi:DNA replication protein DnaC